MFKADTTPLRCSQQKVLLPSFGMYSRNDSDAAVNAENHVVALEVTGTIGHDDQLVQT